MKIKSMNGRIVILPILFFLFGCRQGSKNDLPVKKTGDIASVSLRADKDSLAIAGLLNLVNEDSIRFFLNKLYGERNYYTPAATQHKETCRQYLAACFRRFHLATAVQEFNKSRGRTMQNITAALPGKGTGAIVIGAHFDTVNGSPGADDNGSGLAAMLEVARVLKGYSADKTIVWAAFDQEEDNMQGSSWFVRHYPRPDAIVGMINMDMIGYVSDQPGSQQIPAGFEGIYPEACRQILNNGSKGDFLICIANQASSTFANSFARNAGKYVPALKRISLEVTGKGEAMPDSRRSDHANFWDNGITALYLGDGANTRNPYYHTPNDTRDKVNYGQVALVTRAVLSLLADICHPVPAQKQ